MTLDIRNLLFEQMNATRLIIEDNLSLIDPRKEIYPGWKLRELLAHMTGWDDAIIAALRAHIDDLPLYLSGIDSLDEYNATSVSSRKEWDDNLIFNEWRETRQKLCQIIEHMSEDKFSSPVAVPWGGISSVMDLMELCREHETEHATDILTWLKTPGKPIERVGG